MMLMYRQANIRQFSRLHQILEYRNERCNELLLKLGSNCLLVGERVTRRKQYTVPLAGRQGVTYLKVPRTGFLLVIEISQDVHFMHNRLS